MKYYINTNKELFGIEQGQEFLVKSDWVECQLQDGGLPYSRYNTDGTPDLECIEQERLATELAIQEAEAKRLKQEALASITVEVNGKVFDGNETARNNMLASIQASQLLNIESTYWKLADNSVQEVTAEEIKEALAKAIQRVGEIVTQ